MMKAIKLIPIIMLLCLTSFGQNGSSNITNTNSQQKVVDPNETIMKYEEFLSKETELHRKYTQEYYDMILKLFGVLGIVIGGVLTWLNWKSKEDIEKQVNVQFKETVQVLLDEKLRQIDSLIKDNKEKSAKQFEEINKLILELSGKSEKQIPLQEQAPVEEESDINNLKNKKVLWVDDHPENNEYPKTILEQAGIVFTEVLDTLPAIEIVKKEKFDLIISDMYRKSSKSAGLDLLKELKKLNIQTPVIIYASPTAINKFGKEALSLGAIAITTGATRVLNIVQKILLNK